MCKSKSQYVVVTTILPDNAVLAPKYDTTDKSAFRSPTTGDLYWWQKERVACYIFHEALNYYACDVCHYFLKPQEEQDNVG